MFSRRFLKVANDGAERTTAVSSFHIWGAATLKASFQIFALTDGDILRREGSCPSGENVREGEMPYTRVSSQARLNYGRHQYMSAVSTRHLQRMCFVKLRLHDVNSGLPSHGLLYMLLYRTPWPSTAWVWTPDVDDNIHYSKPKRSNRLPRIRLAVLRRTRPQLVRTIPIPSHITTPCLLVLVWSWTPI